MTMGKVIGGCNPRGEIYKAIRVALRRAAEAPRLCRFVWKR